DLEATATTLGFDSAVAVVMDALDRVHTTATSHRRVMVVEVKGRHAGWIALDGGIAGGGGIVFTTQIPFAFNTILGAVKAREAAGHRAAKTWRTGEARCGRRRISSGRSRRYCSAGDCETHWQGNTLLRSRPSATWRRAHNARSHLGTRFGVKAVQLANER